jgi:hypothetical protein
MGYRYLILFDVNKWYKFLFLSLGKPKTIIKLHRTRQSLTYLLDRNILFMSLYLFLAYIYCSFYLFLLHLTLSYAPLHSFLLLIEVAWKRLLFSNKAACIYLLLFYFVIIFVLCAITCLLLLL